LAKSRDGSFGATREGKGYGLWEGKVEPGLPAVKEKNWEARLGEREGRLSVCWRRKCKEGQAITARQWQQRGGEFNQLP